MGHGYESLACLFCLLACTTTLRVLYNTWRHYFFFPISYSCFMLGNVMHSWVSWLGGFMMGRSTGGLVEELFFLHAFMFYIVVTFYLSSSMLSPIQLRIGWGWTTRVKRFLGGKGKKYIPNWTAGGDYLSIFHVLLLVTFVASFIPSLYSIPTSRFSFSVSPAFFFLPFLFPFSFRDGDGRPRIREMHTRIDKTEGKTQTED